MELRTLVRDCLYVNWALPVGWLPSPPEPLRHDLHRWQGEDYAFVTVLAFRQQGVRFSALPLLRASYPQCNLRFNTSGEDTAPSVFFRALLVPRWVAGAARLVARQDARAARFAYPRPGAAAPEAGWEWTVRQGPRRLTLRARPGGAAIPAGPSLGSWEETVRYFRVRPLGYGVYGGRLRRIQSSHPRVAVCPVVAEVETDGLLRKLLPIPAGESWPPVHSAFLCPEVPFTFELSRARSPGVARRAPVPG